MRKLLGRMLPLLVILLALLLAYSFDVQHYLSFESLKQHRQWLLSWTQQHYLLSLLGFALIYVLAVTLSIPGAVFLTLLAGFLFGRVLGTLVVVCSATLGASLIFLAVQFAIGDSLARRAQGWLSRLQQGFQQNAFSYLLVLRLVPLFPFWVVNIVPALLNIKRTTFVLATFIGIIPGSFVYVMVGNGLGHIFDQDAVPDLGIIFEPAIFLPLMGLAVLATLPILYKRYQGSSHA